MFIEKGYKETTMLDIIREAGVSAGTFQNIFRTKDGVLIELVNVMFDNQFSTAESIVGGSSDPVLLYSVELAVQMTLAELNENLRQIYVEAYTQPKINEYICQKTSSELYKLFGGIMPQYSESDFYESDIGNAADSLMYKYIRLKRIKLNGKRCEISTRLKEGDKVDMYINDEFFEQRFDRYDFMHASTNLTVIYEDENIMLLDKKVGLLSHPDEREYNDTLLTRIKRYLYEKGEYNPSDENSFSPALINRIDRNTGGIVMAAKNAEALRIMNQKLKDREIKKFYLCVVHGTLKEKEGILHGWLTKDEKKNLVKVFTRQTDGSKEIKTKYRVLAENKNMSLVEVELLTGRTHQIRAHFASIGHPLLGDGKYGRNSMNKESGYKKQFLYSYKLKFDFVTDAQSLNYLNGKQFEVNNVWFKDAFLNSEL